MPTKQSSDRHFPGGQFDRKVMDRKERFEALNEFVIERHGWLISVPGAREVLLEVLVDSDLPNDLALLNYELTPEGQSERILTGSIIELFSRRSDGDLEPLTEGSTKPVVRIEHSGIVKTRRFSFELP